MKICLVTAFPPSRGGLTEYGYHIARELQRNPFLSLTVLADELPSEQAELEGFSVVRCWSFNDLRSIGTLLGRIRKLNPDVVWFNLIFSTFGRNPLAAFCGLTLPLLSRLSGCYTHVTLHHLMEGIDLGDAGVRFPSLYRVAGTVATKVLLKSNSVSVLIPAYRKILMEKYGSRNVHVRAHGILSQRPEYPDFSKRGNPCQRILAFGKWGTYKRLEPLIEAFGAIAARVPRARLVVAGGDHPHAPGYVASVAKRFASDSRIEFIGYVPETLIPDLFQRASVAVMPYSSATGSSGVAHLASAYGVPIISADIGEFRDMAQEEGLAIEFYEAGNTLDLAGRVTSLLESPEMQRRMAEQNFFAALRMTMPQIAYRYLRHFDLERKTRTLKLITRLRKLPRWFPGRALVSSAVARSSPAQIYRRDLFHPTSHGLTSLGERFRTEGLEGSRNGVGHDHLSASSSNGAAGPSANAEQKTVMTTLSAIRLNANLPVL
ncbi:MAG TPA: glycosyltransferase [Verrucomicrobiae bacterium]|jgi:glycosyltransferase involved in cell wall biosynthesis|nr:glycosyltransferase [Verrucomicrobiae bacterium]